MAKRCIFCGKEFGLFGGGMVLCGSTDEPVCSSCVDFVTPLTPTERAEKALATGRALYPEELQEFLDQDRQEREEQQARHDRARQALRTDKTCLRCGGPMEKYGTKLFHLGDEGFLGPVARDGLFASWLEADVLRCAQCGMAEFYLPDPPPLPKPPAEKEELVTCPVCGTRHNPQVACPNCAAMWGTSGRSGGGRQGGTKPPWEK